MRSDLGKLWRAQLALPLVLLSLGGCFDDTLLDPSVDPGVVAAAARPAPLTLVAQLVDSGFTRPLLERALGSVMADQLAAAVAPLAVAHTAEQRRSATALLMVAQTQLRSAASPNASMPRGPFRSLSASETDAESAIIDDALSLILADALQTLTATVRDSTGGSQS